MFCFQGNDNSNPPLGISRGWETSSNDASSSGNGRQSAGREGVQYGEEGTKQPVTSDEPKLQKHQSGQGRNVQPIFFRTKMCPKFPGRCRRGSRCNYAHHLDELRMAADLTRTKVCEAFMQGDCQYSDDSCRFAHGREKLRWTENLYKTSMCRYIERKQACPSRERCRHAHSRAEMRQPTPITAKEEGIPINQAITSSTWQATSSEEYAGQVGSSKQSLGLCEAESGEHVTVDPSTKASDPSGHSSSTNEKTGKGTPRQQYIEGQLWESSDTKSHDMMTESEQVPMVPLQSVASSTFATVWPYSSRPLSEVGAAVWPYGGRTSEVTNPIEFGDELARFSQVSDFRPDPFRASNSGLGDSLYNNITINSPPPPIRQSQPQMFYMLPPTGMALPIIPQALDASTTSGHHHNSLQSALDEKSMPIAQAIAQNRQSVLTLETYLGAYFRNFNYSVREVDDLVLMMTRLRDFHRCT